MVNHDSTTSEREREEGGTATLISTLNLIITGKRDDRVVSILYNGEPTRSVK